MSQAIIERMPEEWAEVELLADGSIFTVKLIGDIRTMDKELLFQAGDEFNVFPAIIRFNDKVYEIADGYAKGFMLNVKDCRPTFIN